MGEERDMPLILHEGTVDYQVPPALRDLDLLQIIGTLPYPRKKRTDLLPQYSTAGGTLKP